MATTERTRLDPVTFSILSSAFVALVDEMVSTVQRSCLSFSIYVGDFSGSLMDADGDLVAEGTRDISVHVGALQPSTKAILEDFPEDEMKPGDVFMFNDPYRGGTHLPDMSFIRPIFWDGRRIGFTCQKGHWLDVGGSIPGSMDALATEIYQEGQDIVPAKIVEEGVPRHDVVNNLLSNIRVPVESAGDMWAQIEATKTGERRLFEMIGKYGLDLVLAAMQGTMDHTERQVIAEVLMCPEGTWEAEDFIDGDPNAPEKGPIRVHAKLTITHNPPKLIYDVRGSGPPTNSGMNSIRSSSFGAIVGGTKHIFPWILLNAGWLRVVEGIYPKESVLNVSRPYAVCGEVAGTYEKLVNSVFAIWAHIKPEKSWAASFNCAYFLSGGHDDRPGLERYFIHYHWVTGGYGGMHGRDGRSGATPIFGAGLQNQSIEQKERQWPVTLQLMERKTNSMGAGKWRGGCGFDTSIRFDNSGGVTLSYVSDRGKNGPGGPPGLFGGKRGIYQGAILNPGRPDERWLDVIFKGVIAEQGDVVNHYTQGGGGYGDPLERDPDAVLEDILDEFVSLEKAREDYGVVINAVDPEVLGYEVDQSATDKLRQTMRGARAS